MIVTVYNKNFEVTKIIDDFISFIWNVHLYKYGDFELCVPYSSDYMTYLELGNYLSIDESDRWMIIEKVEATLDEESGYVAKISGRSLESLLARRIIWPQTTTGTNLQNSLMSMILNNTSNTRDLSMVFINKQIPEIKTIHIDEHQYTGDNLYEVISDLCGVCDVGFKVLYSGSEQGDFSFELFKGTDRTGYTSVIQLQTIIGPPKVEFSVNNDNLLSSNYTLDNTNYNNVAYIAGEGEGLSRKSVTYGSASGLDRYELFVDARDISSNNGQITTAEYNRMLTERGKENLLEHVQICESEASVDTSGFSYEYGKDYSLGDLVLIEDVLGLSHKARIVQVTISEDSSGYFVHPTFEFRD